MKTKKAPDPTAYRFVLDDVPAAAVAPLMAFLGIGSSEYRPALDSGRFRSYLGARYGYRTHLSVTRQADPPSIAEVEEAFRRKLAGEG